MPAPPITERNGRWRLARRLVDPFLYLLALFAVLLEATVWRWLTALGRLFARLPVFAWLERVIERSSPNTVVAVFVVPFIPLVPTIKFGELWLLRHHHFIWAAVLIVAAKVVGVAFSTRVLAIARPKMRQVRWFAVSEAWVLRLLETGHALMDSVPAYRAVRDAARRLREGARRAWRSLREWLARSGDDWLRRRYAAARRRLR